MATTQKYYKFFLIKHLLKETENQYVQAIGKYIPINSKLQSVKFRKDEDEENIGLNFTYCKRIPAKITHLQVFGKIICSKKMIIVDLYSELSCEYSVKERTSFYKKIYNCDENTVTLKDYKIKYEDVDMFRRAEQMLIKLKIEDREARARDKVEAEARELKRKRIEDDDDVDWVKLAVDTLVEMRSAVEAEEIKKKCVENDKINKPPKKGGLFKNTDEKDKIDDLWGVDDEDEDLMSAVAAFEANLKI